MKILGIGNAIVDVICKVEDSFLEQRSLTKSTMKLVDEKEFKIKYRNTLDNLPIDQRIADSIIEEANRSFKYNMDIFNELEGNLIAAIGKVLFRFFANKKRKGSTE